ncbi:MAG: cadherin-like domain-containing protein [Verrucomicrobiales bacterium]
MRTSCPPPADLSICRAIPSRLAWLVRLAWMMSLVLGNFCSHAFADATVKLAWDPNPESDDVTGYRVYYGTVEGIYPNDVDAGNTTNATVSGLIDGRKYFFVVTAYNASGLESLPSESVSNDGVTNELPTISLSVSNGESRFVEPAVVSLEAAVADANGTVVAVKFFEGSTVIGEVSSEPFIFEWSPVMQGIHVISARAYDNEGAFSDSERLRIDVARSPNEHIELLEAEDGEFEAGKNALFKSFDPSASEKQYVEVRNSSSFGSATVGFEFEIPVIGNYQIWSRVFAPRKNANAYRVSIDGLWYVHYVYGNPDPPLSAYSQQWKWFRLPDSFYLEPGVHFLAFGNVDSWPWIDRLVVTSDRNFVPDNSLPSRGDFVAITTQPQSQPFLQGSDATLVVVAVATGPATFQWMKDGRVIAGANDTLLTLEEMQMEDIGNYTVVVTSGTASVVSESAILDKMPPQLVANALNVIEGQNITIASELLRAEGGAVDANDLVFVLSNLFGGTFFNADHEIVESFTQAEVVSGLISFAHDGANRAPRYLVSVSDGELSSEPQPATIEFTSVNDSPQIEIGVIGLTEGETIVLTPEMLSASDEETPSGDLIFTVSNVTGGDFRDLGNQPVMSFSQAQVASGAVSFVHDGSEAVPNFRISVSDGTLASESQLAVVEFTSVDDPPQLSANFVRVLEGGAITLTSENFNASDEESDNASLVFTVNDLVAGEFYVNGRLSQTFSNQQLQSGEVTFVHDGSKTPPSFRISISDGGQSTEPVAGSVTFVTFPLIESLRPVAPGTIEITIVGDAGQAGQLQFSSDLLTWEVHSDWINTDGSLIVTDSKPFTPEEPIRYYRLTVE